jgi:hypothetical protein
MALRRCQSGASRRMKRLPFLEKPAPRQVIVVPMDEGRENNIVFLQLSSTQE